MNKIMENIQQGKIYLGMAKSRDEFAVSLPAGGCYGKKRIYYTFARSLAAASRKLNKVDCVDKCFFVYDEDSLLFKTLTHEYFWNHDMTLNGLAYDTDNPFNVQL